MTTDRMREVSIYDWRLYFYDGDNPTPATLAMRERAAKAYVADLMRSHGLDPNIPAATQTAAPPKTRARGAK